MHVSRKPCREHAESGLLHLALPVLTTEGANKCLSII